MRNIRLSVQYEGTDFKGWQYQREKRTVQGTLEAALRRILKEDIKVIGAGRTDAGVHALRQVANFKSSSSIPCLNLRKALNALLPEDIRVLDVEEVPGDFHARYSAKAKIYEYRILQSPEPDPFMRRFVWHVPYPLREDLLRACLEFLLGEHDFSSFRSADSSVKSSVRHMYEATLIHQDRLYSLRFKANGFLRHMVRNIVGTLVHLSLKHKDLEHFIQLMEKKDRRFAGPKAPAQGLYLVDVIY